MYFDQLGNEISKEKFIELYGNSYFICSERAVKGISQNSTYIENEIEKILKNGIKEKSDIFKILAWKIGKIRHGESQCKKDFVFSKDWESVLSGKVYFHGNFIDLNNFAEYIVSNINTLEQTAKSDPQKVLNDLRDNCPKYIGTVYLITLLFFISKGKYPIYDRFALRALKAISNDLKPGSIIKDEELPDKNSKKFASVFNDGMNPYIKLLKDNFGNQYQRKRNIDQALWVYGHCIKQK